MGILGFSRCALMSLAAVAMLAGCGGSQPPIGAPGAMPKMQPIAKASSGRFTYRLTKGLLFVALPDSEYPYLGIKVYDLRKADPKPLVDITNGVSQPQSVCIDHRRTLYVVNGTGSISEYKLGSTSPSKMITQGLNEPAFCAIDAHDSLWITNVGGANITEYLHGSSTPNKVITRGITEPVGIAIDRAGNIYVANHYNASNTNIQVYHSGRSTPSRTITAGVEWPVGIGVDRAGTLYVTNLVPGNIAEYRSGSNKPYHTITQKMNGPAAVTFSPSGWMYVSNYGEQGGGSGPPKVVLEFPPGSQTPGKKMITQGLYLPLGTAFYPPYLP
jgi:hypothetical protein